MREIDPKKVPEMMLSGELRFGMELDFFCDQLEDWMGIKEFTGFSLTRGFEANNCYGDYTKARFPLPKLRDGDPAWARESDDHRWMPVIVKGFNDSGELEYYVMGSKWVAYNINPNWITSSFKYWRRPTRQELESAGYSPEQITELESRGCVK